MQRTSELTTTTLTSHQTTLARWTLLLCLTCRQRCTLWYGAATPTMMVTFCVARSSLPSHDPMALFLHSVATPSQDRMYWAGVTSPDCTQGKSMDQHSLT